MNDECSKDYYSKVKYYQTAYFLVDYQKLSIKLRELLFRKRLIINLISLIF